MSTSVVRRGIAIALIAAAGLASARAESKPPVKVASVEGITEYRLDNGLRVLLFPDPSAPKVTVNMTVLVGSRHEGYGETGMAHLLEHMVFKGTPDAPRHPQGPEGARGDQFNGIDLARPHQLLRDAARHRRQPRVRHRARGRPAGQQLRQGRGPDDRDDRRPQRVRERARTRPQRDPRPADDGRRPTSGTTTASRRSATAATSSACRSTGSRRSTASTTSPTTPCSSSPASSTRRRRWTWSPSTSARSRSRRASSTPTYTEEPPQDGERLVTLRRVGDVAGRRRAVPRPRRGRTPSSPPCRSWPASCRPQPSGPAVQGAGRDRRRPRACSALGASHARPGRARGHGRGAQGRSRSRTSATADRDRRGHEGEGVTAEEVERASGRSSRSASWRRPTPTRSPSGSASGHRAGRLAALLPRPRPDREGHARAGQGGRRRST